MMKKLLILAYDFPPYVSVGGLRPYAWYRYLKEYGVEPIVVTRQWGNKYGNELDYIAPGESNETIVETTEYGTIIRTPYKPNLANRIMLKYGRSKFALIRKMVTAWYEFMQFLFFVGPKSGLYRGAKEYLKQNKVDAIIATGEPFILFKYASALSKKYGVPWIADYRDPWSQNKNRSNTEFKRKWNEHFEKNFTYNAKYVTTVGESFKIQIENLVKCQFFIINNGYDFESVEKASKIQQANDILRIAFVGRIYKWHPVECVLDAFANFIKSHNNPKIELNFYGINIGNELSGVVNAKYPCLIGHVNIYDKMPNDKLIECLAKHNLMLLFNYYNFMGTKIYDYLGIKRRILLCYSNDPCANELKAKYYPSAEQIGNPHLQEELIRETKSGIILKDKDHLEKVLESLYEEFIEKGCIECDSVGVESYSREKQTSLLADIIKQL